MRDPKVIMELYGVMLRAVVDQKADHHNTLKVFAKILPQFEAECRDAFVLITRTPGTGTDLYAAFIKAIEPIVSYIEDLQKSSTTTIQIHLASIALAAAVEGMVKSAKENSEILYCTAPFRDARIELDEKKYFLFDKMTAAIPEVIQRFSKFNFASEVPGFLNAIKLDAKDAYESGRVNDPDGYKQLMSVLSAQQN